MKRLHSSRAQRNDWWLQHAAAQAQASTAAHSLPWTRTLLWSLAQAKPRVFRASISQPFARGTPFWYIPLVTPLPRSLAFSFLALHRGEETSTAYCHMQVGTVWVCAGSELGGGGGAPSPTQGWWPGRTVRLVSWVVQAEGFLAA